MHNPLFKVFAQSGGNPLQLEPVGLSFLDTAITYMQKFMDFVQGPYALFVLGVMGIVVVLTLALKPKDGVMEVVLRWTSIAFAGFSIFPALALIRDAF
jgi:hypothetical protein